MSSLPYHDNTIGIPPIIPIYCIFYHKIIALSIVGRYLYFY